jgi:uncharacterized damage-inducible protein DinB
MTARQTMLDAYDLAYDRQSWHGTNLRGSIRGLTLKQVSSRPGRGRHNIWEVVVHCAYWKYAVLRRLTGQKRGSFPLKGSNWFLRPAPDHATLRARQDAWNDDVALLERMHRELRAAIAALPESSLGPARRSPTVTPAWLIHGIIAHDLYHAGQIQMLKRLNRSI